METREIDLDVLENQISFDFDEPIEESIIVTEKLIKPLNHDYIKDEVLFVAVKAQNKAICEDYSSLKICGKKTIDWVLLAGSLCEEVVIEDCEDILARVRNIKTDKKYIAVFYSDTPLLDKASFFKIIDHFAAKSMNYLQLSRGFVVRSEFLKDNPSFISSATTGNDVISLFICNTSEKLVYAHSVLNERILNYHINNGVTIFGKSTVFIDGDVEIDGGTIIYPNNVLQGESVISSGCILESGNIIENSIILSGCVVKGAFIKDSKITEGKKIEAGSKIVGEVI